MPEITVIQKSKVHQLEVKKGSILRNVLLENGFSPYTKLTSSLNCGGRGICASCGVWVKQGEPKPTHWHDAIGKSFGYPRLSCQMKVEKEMVVELIDNKWIWT